MTIDSSGEILWDVFAGPTERLGGAPFNFAVQARRLGHEVILISAVADDDRGRRALKCAAGLGISTEFIQVVSIAPTGSVSVLLDAAGQPDFTIHRPAAYDFLQLDEAQLRKHPAGTYGPHHVLLSADGKTYAYQIGRQLSNLYLVEGLK